MIKTRFAPSPTGYLHLGGARTALYNWLFARQNNGQFVLRIEDTDTERSTKESTEQIFKSLAYLGLNYDAEPIIQSERLTIYQDYARKLISQGLAYEQDGAVYFRILEEIKEVTFQDLIIGQVSVPKKELTDFVILKSNGWPVYHFSVVIDDALMQISHVIRGMDHLTNTAKHILLFQALGFNLPIFAHIPMILGSDKERLSKRHGAMGVDEYQKQGILPSALINFLARLGWGYKDQEVFTKNDLLEKFDLTKVSKSPAVFDPNKLVWLNKEHLKLVDIEALIDILDNSGQECLELTNTGDRRLETVEKIDFSDYKKEIELLKSRARSVFEIIDHLSYFINDPREFDETGIKKHFTSEKNVEYLEKLATNLDKISDFSANNIEKVLRLTANELNINAAILIHTSRLVLTGVTVGPGIFELMEVLGKEKVKKRFRSFCLNKNLVMNFETQKFE